ncbi:hypothetical protein ACWI_34030 [Acetobacterium wieringae]|uniref:Uncharacterized protein n=1 Tax=Acetobacterium wieringae TaxID=52694 RepID=A0A1F2PEK2_9FIRM|nr:hypothetical protein ACWI_34030 [Acetobacterium wieringae]
MDELGSGIRNTYKYCKIYSGTAPIFIEGDVFRTIIPLSMVAGDQATPTAESKGQPFHLASTAKVDVF